MQTFNFRCPFPFRGIFGNSPTAKAWFDVLQPYFDDEMPVTGVMMDMQASFGYFGHGSEHVYSDTYYKATLILGGTHYFVVTWLGRYMESPMVETAGPVDIPWPIDMGELGRPRRVGEWTTKHQLLQQILLHAGEETVRIRRTPRFRKRHNCCVRGCDNLRMMGAVRCSVHQYEPDYGCLFFGCREGTLERFCHKHDAQWGNYVALCLPENRGVSIVEFLVYVRAAAFFPAEITIHGVPIGIDIDTMEKALLAPGDL